MSLQPLYISGSNAGLRTDVKPYLLPDQAFSTIENAYVWRERVKKREGIRLLGRLKRALSAQALGNTDGAGNFSGNIFTILGISVTEPQAQIEAGSISINVGGGAQIFTEPATPNGTLTNGAAGTGTINYTTGALTLNTDPNLAVSPILITFNYFPGLPVMGIIIRDDTNNNDEQTVFFDTRYAYINNTGFNGFQEFISGTTWTGSNSQYFWGANYRGSTANLRLFFVTNFNVGGADPIRYTNGATWTTFTPLITAADSLFQARIIIPYYGRLLMLNTYEGTTAGGFGASSNFFNRARFSQIGDPTAADAWRSDQFGKGGFIDAPTNEAIISAAFFQNTLIIFFERSTWQLRYVGEYGIPFLWERISSDFGSEATFSSVIFDQGVLTVGERAIISASSVNAQRIDEQIPDVVFGFRNDDSGVERVHGFRDFQKELVYWCYVDAELNGLFANKTLVYNYRNNTYAEFRNNVTTFGTYQAVDGITWDNTEITWDDETITWDDPSNDALFPLTVIGNQQGYVHYYGYQSFDDSSLRIEAINTNVSPNTITSTNHNLETGDIIYIENMLFSVSPSVNLNDRVYYVQYTNVNSFSILQWNGQLFVNTPAVGASTYVGNGSMRLLPRLNLETKDFNPFTTQGRQIFLSYVDFLLDTTPSARFSIQLLINSSPSVVGNLITGQAQLESFDGRISAISAATQANPCQITSNDHGLSTGDGIVIDGVVGMYELNGLSYIVTVVDEDNFTLNGINSSGFGSYTTGGNWVVVDVPNFYTPNSKYLWHRFYATATGQFIRLRYFYDDELMSQISTNQQDWTLNSIALYVRPAGRNVF